jgi:arylsulfatase A-like enzyme
MLKDRARWGLNKAKGVRDRLSYASRSADVPGLDPDRRPNVLIITVDCLRDDRLSRAGYDRKTTPFLDSFGTHTSAITAAPWTFSSVPSILTGMYPHRHGAAYPKTSARNQDLSNPPNGVREDVQTLPEVLAGAGYETAFFTAIETAAIPIRGRFPTMGRRHFDPAGELLGEVEDWWTGQSGPRFGYVQLGDLHEPFHEPEQMPFGTIPDVDGVDRWRFQDGAVGGEEFETYREAKNRYYDTLVHEVDQAIADLLDRLDAIEDTLVVVTSDHGEEFWEFVDFEREHFDDPRDIYGVGHGHALVPPVLNVPIVTNADGVDADGTRRSTVDIVPTVFEALGAKPGLDLDGVALQADRSEPVLCQEIAYEANQVSVTRDGAHLIHEPETGQSVTMDFESGAVHEDGEVAAELAEYLPGEGRTGASVEISEDVEARLSELGYAE